MMTSNTPPTSFTGRSRRRKTSSLVKIVDKVARTLITVGGLGTILAVSTVCLFLIYVAVPLFKSPSSEQRSQYASPFGAYAQALDASQQIARFIVDEYMVLGLVMFEDGTVQVFRLDNGEKLGDRLKPFGDVTPTAMSFLPDSDESAFGFEDGTVRLGSFGIEVSFVREASLPESLQDMKPDTQATLDNAVIVRTETGQYRRHELVYRLDDPIQISDQPIDLVGHTIRGDSPIFVTYTRDNTMTYNAVRATRHFLTGKLTFELSRGDIPFEMPDGVEKPMSLMISGRGDSVFLTWREGLMYRYDTRRASDVVLAEKVQLIDKPGVSISAINFMIGRTTILVGDTNGGVSAWFRVRPEGVQTSDSYVLRRTHDLGQEGTMVTQFAVSERSRMIAAGYRDGHVRLFYVTNNELLAEIRTTQTEPILALAMGGRENAIAAFNTDDFFVWDFDRRHPSITLKSVFAPVWYEGYNEPLHMWQSSAGTDDFEPKYGMIPLIFGTLKATFYSMLFGLPIALLAAVYTSEFLHPKLKSKIKPMIEMMASLPSVVLGFLAALVIAPVIEKIVPGSLSAFFTIPVCFLLGAYVWQMLPLRWLGVLMPYRLFFILLMIPLGLVLAIGIGPWPGFGVFVERLLFAGDIKRWLDGQVGSGFGGWMILFIPISGILTACLSGMYLSPALRTWMFGMTRVQAGVVSLVRFIALCMVALCIAAVFSGLLTLIGFDPRGQGVADPFGTYMQRNALIVGFIMGFAIIPIVYTIADDAMSAVPEHLRSGSLGAGATPWQTAVRIIIPTAMSGIFSATMIGLGRAVGETMIVLMAAGNTPLMQMNIFNGFRTLSANIAVELPEAPIGGTHYRMLFLAALTLFAMTFVVNTVAEIIRLRFRKRAYQL